MRTIGIVGSRRRDTPNDQRLIEEKFTELYEPGDRIVSGGCPVGADAFAEVLAKNCGTTITIHYPDWNGKGRAAGPIRNTLIADDCDVLIAAVAPDRTGGTEDTVKKCEKRGKEVHLV